MKKLFFFLFVIGISLSFAQLVKPGRGGSGGASTGNPDSLGGKNATEYTLKTLMNDSLAQLRNSFLWKAESASTVNGWYKRPYIDALLNAKLDVASGVDLSSIQTITGSKTFSAGTSTGITEFIKTGNGNVVRITRSGNGSGALILITDTSSSGNTFYFVHKNGLVSTLSALGVWSLNQLTLTNALDTANSNSISGIDISGGTVTPNGGHRVKIVITGGSNSTGSIIRDSLNQLSTGAKLKPALLGTGTPSASTFLRGDSSWATPAGGGDISKVGTPTNGQLGRWNSSTTMKAIDVGYGLDTAGSSLKIDTLLIAKKSNIIPSSATGNEILYINSTGDTVKSVTGVSPTEAGYLDGVTSSIQTQINAKRNNTDTTVVANGNGITVTYSNHTATVANTAPIVISIPLDSSYINTTDTVIVGSIPYALTIDSLKFVNHGTVASVTYKVGYGTNITSFTLIVTAGTASTSISIGDKVTSLNNTAPSANSYFAVMCSSVTTKPKKAVITIFAHR